MKKQTFLCGIFILTIGTLLAKFIGAIYRIPLTWLLGVQGLGIYQLVYPMFSLLLILSSTGAPTAISAMVSQRIKVGKYLEARKIFRISLISLFVIGVIFAIFLFAMSDVLANIQGNTLARMPYMTIALAIPLVSILSAYRGYYQGCQNMVPTSLSQVVEQLGKLVLGLIFANMLLPYGIQYGVVGAFLGVVGGEVLAVLTTIVYHRIIQKKHFSPSQITDDNIIPTRVLIVELLKRSTPIIIASMALPLLQVLDSFLVPNLLTMSGFTIEQSTVMWGIYSGMVTSIINMPIVLTLSIATSIVPEMSSVEHKLDLQKVQNSFLLTLNIALPSMLGILILAPQIIKFLYADTLSDIILDEFALSTNLLLLGSILILLTSIMQIQNATLQSINRSFVPLRNIMLAGILKVSLTILLVVLADLSIYGVVLSNICFYLTITILNFVYMRTKLHVRNTWGNTLPSFCSSCVMGVVLLMSVFAFANFSLYLRLPIQILLGVLVYFATLLVLSRDVSLVQFLSKRTKRVYKK